MCKPTVPPGGKYGSLMFHQKSVHSYGGPIQDAYPHGRICTRRSRLKQSMSCAAITSRQLAMCYGSVHLRVMFGLYLKAGSRSVGMSLANSSSFSNRCSKSLVPLNWRNGQPQLGRSGE